MRSFAASNHSSSTKSLTINDLASAQQKKRSSRPDWMKRLQEQRKQQKQQAEQEEQEIICSTKNCDLSLFQSFNRSISSEITYLDDEDDLAASYFPGASSTSTKQLGSSCSSLDLDDLPAVSGYNFGELIEKEFPATSGYNFDKIIG